MAGILTCAGNICGSWCCYLSAHPSQYLRPEYTNTYVPQTVKDVRGSQDTIIDTFERIESSIQRLKIYTEVRPTPEMTKTIILIMVEVISILGIATKEIKEGIMSEWISSSTSRLTERCSETFAKRLVGRTDLEDALKRLDKLTQEEARMATAEVLRTTRAIEEGVTGVGEQVLVIDDRVAGVNNRVVGVDDKVTEIINGAQIIICRAREMLNFDCSDMKQTANDVNQAKRSLHPDIL